MILHTHYALTVTKFGQNIKIQIIKRLFAIHVESKLMIGHEMTELVTWNLYATTVNTKTKITF